MPRYPLYVAWLPQEAQDVIGKAHQASVPARRMLEQEGMHFEGYVDIFDAGPVLQARCRELRVVRDSGLAQIDAHGANASSHDEAAPPSPENALPIALPMLISNTVMSRFRVIVIASVL